MTSSKSIVHSGSVASPPQNPSRITVVFASDANYLQAAKLAIYAASQHTSGLVDFVLLTGASQIAPEDCADLRAVLKPGHSLRIIECTDPRLRNCALFVEYITIASFFRLLLPELLPDASRCIYLDCDVLVLDDLQKLWAEAGPDAPLCAVREIQKEAELLHTAILGTPDYFNSGVLVLNLDLWRAHQYTDACFRLATSGDPRLTLQDQDVLNLIFRDNTCFLDMRWNLLGSVFDSRASNVRFFSRTEWLRLRDHPGIAHFASKNKPWNLAMQQHWSLAYWQRVMKSPWAPAYAGRFAKARRQYAIWRVKHWIKWAVQIRFKPSQHLIFIVLFGHKFSFLTPLNTATRTQDPVTRLPV